MASNQEGRHAAVRALTSTSGSYNSDFLALFADAGFTTGSFNERFLAWLNSELGVTHTSLPAAMQAYAVSLGARNWDSLNTIESAGDFPNAATAGVQSGITLTPVTGAVESSSNGQTIENLAISGS